MAEVVTCFLEYENRILILKRSNRVKTYKGHWAGISGYIEKDETPLDAAKKEIKEETGIASKDCRLIRKGKVINISSEYDGKIYAWIIHPFLFATKTNEILLDWEHTEYRWITPRDIRRYKTVPKLKDALVAVTKCGHQQPHD